jgi:hypothetical protein
MSANTLTRGAERRRSERKQHVAGAWIQSPTSTDPSERIEVTSVNISRHGVCFSLLRPIPDGAFYMMEVSLGEQKIVSEIQIVNCRRDATGRFDVGAEFC